MNDDCEFSPFSPQCNRVLTTINHVPCELTVTTRRFPITRSGSARRESGRVGEWESGRVGEWESGRVGEWESGCAPLWTGHASDGRSALLAPSPHRPIAPSPHRPIAPSPHRPIAPSPHHPIAPSPHHPITPSPPRPLLCAYFAIASCELARGVFCVKHLLDTLSSISSHRLTLIRGVQNVFDGSRQCGR